MKMLTKPMGIKVILSCNIYVFNSFSCKLLQETKLNYTVDTCDVFLTLHAEQRTEIQVITRHW